MLKPFIFTNQFSNSGRALMVNDSTSIMVNPTIPTPVALSIPKGASFHIASGQALTIIGPIFVTATAGAVSDIGPEWQTCNASTTCNRTGQEAIQSRAERSNRRTRQIEGRFSCRLHYQEYAATTRGGPGIESVTVVCKTTSKFFFCQPAGTLRRPSSNN